MGCAASVEPLLRALDDQIRACRRLRENLAYVSSGDWPLGTRLPPMRLRIGWWCGSEEEGAEPSAERPARRQRVFRLMPVEDWPGMWDVAAAPLAANLLVVPAERV